MKVRDILRGIKMFLLLFALCWCEARIGISTGMQILLGVVLCIVLVLLGSPAFEHYIRLRRIVRKEGYYKGGYVKELERVAKGNSMDSIVARLDLISINIKMGELKRAEEVLLSIPADWVEQEKRKNNNRIQLRNVGALYYNDAMVCYVYLKDRERVEKYYDAGIDTINAYLEAEDAVNEIIKGAMRTTIAAYHIMREEYDDALQLLNRIKAMVEEQNVKGDTSGILFSVTKQKAQILIKTQKYEEARLLLEDIRGKSDAPYYNQVVEEMLEDISG